MASAYRASLCSFGTSGFFSSAAEVVDANARNEGHPQGSPRSKVTRLGVQKLNHSFAKVENAWSCSLASLAQALSLQVFEDQLGNPCEQKIMTSQMSKQLAPGLN